jgi:hypothetical protein
MEWAVVGLFGSCPNAVHISSHVFALPSRIQSKIFGALDPRHLRDMLAKRPDFTSELLPIPGSPKQARNCSTKEVNSRLFELARVLVRFHHLARLIVNANHA